MCEFHIKVKAIYNLALLIESEQIDTDLTSILIYNPGNTSSSDILEPRKKNKYMQIIYAGNHYFL